LPFVKSRLGFPDRAGGGAGALVEGKKSTQLRPRTSTRGLPKLPLQSPEGKLSYGVIASNSGLNLQAFAERAHIPVAFTLHGLSALPVDHPVSLGMVGMHGTVEANRAMMNADLILYH